MANSLVQVRVDEQLKEEGIPFSMKLTDIQRVNKAVLAMQRMSKAAEENGIADMALQEQ